MIDKDWTFILGAQDPEMREIERMLDADHRPWMHAARKGRRCTAANAYSADGVVQVGLDKIPRPRVLPPRSSILSYRSWMRYLG